MQDDGIASRPRRLAHHVFTTLAMTAIAIPALSANWQPPQEPTQWLSVRQSLQSAGTIAVAPWIFFGSLDRESTQAAEYLSNLRAEDGLVEFDGLLLLKRSSASPWSVRPLTMRAICREGRLERQQTDGSWEDYSGRPGTREKVDWICQQPH